jgi:hypothetical protein
MAFDTCNIVEIENLAARRIREHRFSHFAYGEEQTTPLKSAGRNLSIMNRTLVLYRERMAVLQELLAEDIDPKLFHKRVLEETECFQFFDKSAHEGGKVIEFRGVKGMQALFAQTLGEIAFDLQMVFPQKRKKKSRTLDSRYEAVQAHILLGAESVAKNVTRLQKLETYITRSAAAIGKEDALLSRLTSKGLTLKRKHLYSAEEIRMAEVGLSKNLLALKECVQRMQSEQEEIALCEDTLESVRRSIGRYKEILSKAIEKKSRVMSTLKRTKKYSKVEKKKRIEKSRGERSELRDMGSRIAKLEIACHKILEVGKTYTKEKSALLACARDLKMPGELIHEYRMAREQGIYAHNLSQELVEFLAQRIQTEQELLDQGGAKHPLLTRHYRERIVPLYFAKRALDSQRRVLENHFSIKRPEKVKEEDTSDSFQIEHSVA